MPKPSLFEKLSRRSQRIRYDVYSYFQWPASFPLDSFWLCPELLTVHGTPHFDALAPSTLARLSQCEAVNLFSVFTRGESDLLQTVLANCIRDDFRDCFEYLTHFVDEENKHMWFFAEFCRRYHGGMYPIRVLKTTSTLPDDMERFLAFARILIFEEMGDYINVRVARDERVPALIREIHHRHHDDEVGHIAAGWSIAEHLLERMTRTREPTDLRQLQGYMESYMSWSLQNLYNPLAYAEVGLPDPYGLRTQLLEHPGRTVAHQAILKRARSRTHRLFEGAGRPGASPKREEGANYV